MTTKQLSAYHLSVEEVYSRQSIYGFQLAPDGNRFSFISQRDKRTSEETKSEQLQVKATAIADLYLLPAQGGYPQPITSSGDMSSSGENVESRT